MEYNYTKIALKQPKADPRTVLLHKRNFMESSSDHIQNFHKQFKADTTTTTIHCDNTKSICEQKSTKCMTTKTILITKISSAFSTSSSSSSSPSSWSSWSATLLLVNSLNSCHFNASTTKNYLYKTQKTTLIFFFLFIWCAILLQTAQAVPTHRVVTSGRKLILHANVFRENYHQKLLEEQRRHKQQQQLIQLQFQEQQHRLQQQQQQLLQLERLQTQSLSHPTIIYHQEAQQKQVQNSYNNQIFSPNQILRRHPQAQAQTQTQTYHRHHLHQRAAPVTSPHHYIQQYKMSYCNGNKIYQNLYHQMNASMLYIKQLCANYLRDRGNETFDDMSETWKLISLETRNPNRKEVLIENELHKKIHDFYLNLHTFDQLLDYAFQDTNDNKTKIEHGEEISIDKIIKFLQSVKAEIKFNMKEAENLLEILEIEKPDLADNTVTFNSNIGRRVRDFLIIKNLIEDFEHVLHLVQNYCENNDAE